MDLSMGMLLSRTVFLEPRLKPVLRESSKDVQEYVGMDKEKLTAVLDKLNSKEFNEVKFRLHSLFMEEANILGFSRIMLQDAKAPPKLVDVLWQHYGSRTEMQLVQLLREVHRHDLADELEIPNIDAEHSTSRNPIHHCLVETLQQLDMDEFSRFKDKLSKFPVKEGFKNSPEKILQTTEVLTLSDHLLFKYGENYALELADAVLKDIKLEHHAVRLRTVPGVRRTVRDCLISILVGLDDHHFKNFKYRLRMEGSRNTLEAILRAAEIQTLADHLLSTYEESDVVERTAAVLEAMRLENHAVTLRNADKRTVRDCLVSTLNTLSTYEYEDFKDELRKEAFSTIPGRVLQAAEVENLTDQLLSKYGKDYVVERTAAALEAIDLKRHAVALRAHTIDRRIVRDCLISTLMDLSDKQFELFKNKLIWKDFEDTPETILHDAEVQILTDRLLSIYGEDSAVWHAVRELKYMNLDYLVERQHDDFGISSWRQPRRIHGRTTRDCLILTLMDLNDFEFNKFKDTLSKFPVKEGFRSISEWELQGMNIQTLSDHLVSSYREDYAVELADAVLKDIKLEPHAVRLRTLLGVRRTVRDCLILTLVGLNYCEFKKFKDKLDKFHVRKGPKELLQSANVQELTSLLLEWYKEDYAVEVTAAVLEAMRLKPHAEKLLALSRIKHFVEMHQEELIRQVCGMDVILFRLLGWILKADEYHNIMAEESDAGKMKMLLKLVPNWTTRKKDHLYQELVQTNGPLIAALEGSSVSGHKDTFPSDEKHFIEKHQEEIIRRVIGIDVILDSLVAHCLVTIEQVPEIKGTTQQKMQKLYQLVPSWTTRKKNTMCSVLKETNPWLFLQLEGGHFVDRHKEELIEQVTEAPLKELRGCVLDEEQYEALENCATEKMKMEALYQIAQAWETQQKNHLYRALAATNSHIIETLEEEHFIEKHQEELIHRVSHVDTILQHLQDICSQISVGSDQQKMKWLYALVPMLSRKQKEHVYALLRETNGPLIAELEEGHFVERHKEELIEKVTNAKMVVQLQFHYTISNCLRRHILRKATDKQKMEALYEVVPGWKRTWKDHLYKVLRETNEDLIKELEGRTNSKAGLIPLPLTEEKCYLYEKEKVQPELILDVDGKLKMYRLCCPEAGTYLCSETELRFEVRGAVMLTYAYGSWDQHLSGAEMQKWMVAGPLFDIQADPAEEVAAVHLPHFICLEGGKVDISQMKVGHFVEEGLLLETPSQVNAFHVVVENPTFSPLGVLICALFGFSVNSLVLLYRTFKPIVTLRLYLIPNDNSVKYAVEAMEKGYGSSPIWKPAKTKPLYYGYSYVVSGSMHKEHKESLRIIPEEMEFSYMSHTQVQSFAEIYIQEKKCVELFLENKENHDLVWKTWLEPEEIEFQEEQSITSSWKEGKAPEMTISDHLKCTLENLKDKDFKQFKRKLNEFPFKKEFKNIPICNIPFCELENADALEVSHLLIKYYTNGYAVEVTTEVLKAISCNQQANDLLCATDEITAKLQGTGKIPGLLLTRGSSHSEEAKEDLWIKTSPRTARKRFLDSVIMIRKGRKHITEILKEDQELFLDELLTQSVITKEEHEMLDKMEADSKKKSRQLLIWIQEKEACVQFLDCMEMFYPGSVSSLQSLLNAQDGNSVETVGQLEEQSDSSPGDYR